MDTWGSVFKDRAMLITLWITVQFFFLILLFSQWPSRMDVEAKETVLQTYIVAFTAAWGYWLGSSVGSKQKDRIIAAQQEEANGRRTQTESKLIEGTGETTITTTATSGS